MNGFNALNNIGLLRFTTAGSVDDGKSTLIGRLLYDSKAIFEDQLSAIELSSKRKGEEHINLAYLTDGLRVEREQGITIDVAYRYFSTPKRKFIIADTPGHIQYTRNMVTGASTVDLAVILIDARNGILEQTIRHSYIASLLGIRHIIVCINKMDMVGFSNDIFENIRIDYHKIVNKLKLEDVHFIPVSALQGDNIVEKSTHTSWYEGPTLLTLLEEINIHQDSGFAGARFPVQYIIRPQSDEFHDYRGYSGRIAGGIFKPGDEVKILPSGLTSKIKSIHFNGHELNSAFAGQSVNMLLEDDLDISRGYLIVKEPDLPKCSQELELIICWFSETSLIPGGKYTVKHLTSDLKCIIKEIHYKVDINSLEKNTKDKSIRMNDISGISIKTTQPLYYDPYKKNRITGSLILINESTNETVAAGIIQ